MSIDTEINLDYLLPQLRMALWDIDSTSYRYTDGWLRVALVTSVKALQRWWKNRYLVDATNNVYRNTTNTYINYELDEPEVIETSDERPIILMASILVKSGVLENNSWNLGSWRDAEYAVSNIASKDAKEKGIDRDWNELIGILKPPTKRLTAGARVSFDFGADETT